MDPYRGAVDRIALEIGREGPGRWRVLIGGSTSMTSKDMRPVSLSPVDLRVFQKNLTLEVASARSLVEIEAWLKLQPFVDSVELVDYLLKSNPPQRVFIVEFKTMGGSTVKKIVTIFDLGNQQFQFHELSCQQH